METSGNVPSLHQSIQTQSLSSSTNVPDVQSTEAQGPQSAHIQPQLPPQFSYPPSIFPSQPSPSLFSSFRPSEFMSGNFPRHMPPRSVYVQETFYSHHRYHDPTFASTPRVSIPEQSTTLLSFLLVAKIVVLEMSRIA